jgi:choline dehydrogenase-like flavoprotein
VRSFSSNVCGSKIHFVMSSKRASGIEIVHNGKVQPIAAGVEVILSWGAIHTPKVLMLSGIGDQTELQRLGTPVVLDNFIRDAASSYWHQTCTAKMGHDSMSVVDCSLKVHGIDNLRIADGSIMPRVTTGNTMAPCVIIGERVAEMLKAAHRT